MVERTQRDRFGVDLGGDTHRQIANEGGLEKKTSRFGALVSRQTVMPFI